MKRPSLPSALLVLSGLVILCAVGFSANAAKRHQRSPHTVRRAHKARTMAVQGPTAADEPIDPPEQTIGERLFLETRFAQFFATHNSGINQPLEQGDPTLSRTPTTHGSLPGPFAGQSMNCRSCHFVDEFVDTKGAGIRTYADFAFRSPIPDRGDGHSTTPRNSPPLVNASIPREAAFLLHFDGEFSSPEGLVIGTLTGRNFGWLPLERADALHHIARVVREDDGTTDLGQEFGGFPYRTLLLGTDSAITPEYRLSEEFRIDVDTATDEQVLQAVSKLIGAYMRGLEFARDEAGAFDSSPYDVFLRKNHLPAQPDAGESAVAYTARLRILVENLRKPDYVVRKDGGFQFHQQNFAFGPLELEGLKIFLRAQRSSRSAGNFGAGNCAACHTAPAFTDFEFHNTGASQEEYDAVHGEGAFAALEIPNLATRNASYDDFLPATQSHPGASGRFRDVPYLNNPGHTDLGLWSIYLNPDMPAPQSALQGTICKVIADCAADSGLARTIGAFKTPGLRDLGHSAPYLHNAEKAQIEDVVRFYRRMSELMRQGRLRNAPLQFSDMVLKPQDVKPLSAFLRALNEDYD